MKIITNIDKLKVPSTKVNLNEDNKVTICDLIEEMKSTMLSAGGIGISHVQVAETEPLQIFLMMDNGNVRVVINPEIIHENKILDCIKESCLSIPDKEVYVCRSYKTLAKFYDENFIEQEILFTGMSSSVFLHEFDHLIGKTILDYEVN